MGILTLLDSKHHRMTNWWHKVLSAVVYVSKRISGTVTISKEIKSE